MSRLAFQMREALEKFQKLWQTLDKDKIMQIIRLCLARELTCVEARKDAKEYREKRPKSFDFFDELGDMSAVKSITASSPSRANSPSPKKTNRDGLKTTMRDGNTTNFEIKSFGESESRNLPRMMGTFKEPPSLKMSMIKMDDRKPTAENLRGLSTARGAASAADGAKSARSRVSQTSKGEPVDPFKDHTVEQMDELILKATQDINKLMNRKKNLENDGLSTKTQIRAKIKPIMEEIQQLRADYNNYMFIRDAKIPDHEKLPKTCIYYKHYLQVE